MCRIAVQRFCLLLILPLDLIIIFLKIKLCVVSASVSNRHNLLEVAHTKVSPRIPSFKIKQCNWSCWLFLSLHIAGAQIGWSLLSWTAQVRGIWPALTAVRSDQHPVSTPGDMPMASKCRADWARYWLKSTVKTAWLRANVHTSQGSL